MKAYEGDALFLLIFNDVIKFIVDVNVNNPLSSNVNVIKCCL